MLMNQARSLMEMKKPFIAVISEHIILNEGFPQLNTSHKQ